MQYDFIGLEEAVITGTIKTNSLCICKLRRRINCS